MGQDQVAAKTVQEAVRANCAKAGAELNQLLKEKAKVKEWEKTLATELEKCHSFRLRINDESFCEASSRWPSIMVYPRTNLGMILIKMLYTGNSYHWKVVMTP